MLITLDAVWIYLLKSLVNTLHNVDCRHVRLKDARYKSSFHDSTLNGRESLTFILTSECFSGVSGTSAKFCLSALLQVIRAIVRAFRVLSQLMNYVGQNSSTVAVRHPVRDYIKTPKSVCSCPTPLDQKRLAFERTQSKAARSKTPPEAVRSAHRTHDTPSSSLPSTQSFQELSRDELCTSLSTSYCGTVQTPSNELEVSQELQQLSQGKSSSAGLSREVDLFVFERHYYANLLLCKGDFIQYYKVVSNQVA